MALTRVTGQTRARQQSDLSMAHAGGSCELLHKSQYGFSGEPSSVNDLITSSLTGRKSPMDPDSGPEKKV